jgi:hypothetical protein
MNELHMIPIINLFHVKFVMFISCYLNFKNKILMKFERYKWKTKCVQSKNNMSPITYISMSKYAYMESK